MKWGAEKVVKELVVGDPFIGTPLLVKYQSDWYPGKAVRKLASGYYEVRYDGYSGKYYVKPENMRCSSFHDGVVDDGREKKHLGKKAPNAKMNEIDEYFQGGASLIAQSEVSSIIKRIEEPIKQLAYERAKQLQEITDLNHICSRVTDALEKAVVSKAELKSNVGNLQDVVSLLEHKNESLQQTIEKLEKDLKESRTRCEKLESIQRDMRRLPTAMNCSSLAKFSAEELQEQEKTLCSLVEEIEETRKRINAQREEQKLCPICYDNTKDCVMNPCGHAFCKTCAAQLEVCALCQTRKKNIIKIYL